MLLKCVKRIILKIYGNLCWTHLLNYIINIRILTYLRTKLRYFSTLMEKLLRI